MCLLLHAQKEKGLFSCKKKKKCSVVITLKLLYCKLADANWGVEKGKRWVETCKLEEKKFTSALEQNDIKRKIEENC